MKSKIDTTNPQYWSALVRQTRSFGHTYVHSQARAEVMGWKGTTFGNVLFTFSGYGRSLQSGGHKYKVHARNVDTGKPTPSKDLP